MATAARVQTPPPVRRKRIEELQDEVIDLAKKARLSSWDEFVEELAVPADLLPALMANRPELLRLAQPREMTKDEVAVLYKLIGGLMETNMTLRTHAERTAQLVDNWAGLFDGLASVGRQIKMYANFRHEDVVYPEGDES